jgi:hypothetical protein
MLGMPLLFSLAFDKLRTKAEKDKRRGRSKVSTSGSSTTHPQVNELNKLVKYMYAEMKKLKLEGRQNYRKPQNVDKRDNFRRPNNATQILPREQRNRDRNVQNI